MEGKTLDVSQWPRSYNDQRHPFWWGMVGLILVEVTVFAVFLASFFYLWIVNVAEQRGGWPPESISQPSRLYPTINILLLLFCGLCVFYGRFAMERGQRMKFFWYSAACCLCAAFVLFFYWLQFLAFPFRWDEHAYTSFFWLLTGFHFFHVLSALIGTAIIGWFGYKGFFTKESFLAVQVFALYWYFVVGSWLPIYATLYLLKGWG